MVKFILSIKYVDIEQECVNKKTVFQFLLKLKLIFVECVETYVPLKYARKYTLINASIYLVRYIIRRNISRVCAKGVSIIERKLRNHTNKLSIGNMKIMMH